MPGDCRIQHKREIWISGAGVVRFHHCLGTVALLRPCWGPWGPWGPQVEAKTLKTGIQWIRIWGSWVQIGKVGELYMRVEVGKKWNWNPNKPGRGRCWRPSNIHKIHVSTRFAHLVINARLGFEQIPAPPDRQRPTWQFGHVSTPPGRAVCNRSQLSSPKYSKQKNNECIYVYI